MISDLFLYVHIPYCKQKCSFCNFATIQGKNLFPPKEYIKILKKEIDQKKDFFKNCLSKTIYFGGGTPSLIPSENIKEIIDHILCSFSFEKNPEISIEINPGTLGEKKLNEYRKYGINRFSLGVQTFDSHFLKNSNREHSVKNSTDDLFLLQKNKLNFSLDIMFGLPKQDISHLKNDLCKALDFEPYHMSVYNLSIPKNHALAKNRASEGSQSEMFYFIEEILEKKNLIKYELSNFSKKGFESKHNLAYWSGKNILGLGLSAHSYLNPSFKNTPSEYGIRFWNSSSLRNYVEQIQKVDELNLKELNEQVKKKQIEYLKPFEALTDFCYTRLRKKKGLLKKELFHSFPLQVTQLVLETINDLRKRGWIEDNNEYFRLSKEGEILSNQIFLELTFLEKDLKI